MVESNAETDLFRDLSARGLTKGMLTNALIILSGCFPDYQWPASKLALFLDGPHHLRDKVEVRDTAIDDLLELLGWTILRYPYKPPLGKKKRKEICDTVEEKQKTLPTKR